MERDQHNSTQIDQLVPPHITSASSGPAGRTWRGGDEVVRSGGEEWWGAEEVRRRGGEEERG